MTAIPFLKTPSCNRLFRSCTASTKSGAAHRKGWGSSGTNIGRDNDHAIQIHVTLLGSVRLQSAREWSTGANDLLKREDEPAQIHCPAAHVCHQVVLTPRPIN